MSWIRLAFAFICLGTMSVAQSLPAGTALPIMLNSSLNAKSAKAGQKIQGKLMQEVTLAPGLKVKSGSHVTGHVLSAVKPSGSGSRITVQFDQLQDEHTIIPLRVSLRAVASSLDVFQAGIPVNNASDSSSSEEWVTKQVGGEYVFRGRGYVTSDQGRVATWSGTGVWGKLAAGGDCQPDPAANPQQALWIFSTTACGAYGLEGVTVTHSGDTDPVGQIVLSSTKDIDIRSGGGWLLVVNAASVGSTDKK